MRGPIVNWRQCRQPRDKRVEKYPVPVFFASWNRADAGSVVEF